MVTNQSSIEKNDLKQPIGFFLKRALPQTTAKITTFLVKNELDVGVSPWRPVEGVMPSAPFIRACSVFESFEHHRRCHHEVLNDEQKEGSIMEKALLKDFWENENNVSTGEIEVVIFDKTAKGVAPEVASAKTNEAAKAWKGTAQSPGARSSKCLDGLMSLPDSVGVAVVKIGRSQESENFLLGGFVEDESIFSRSLSKEH